MSDAQNKAFVNVPAGTSEGLAVDIGTGNDVIIDVVSVGNGATDEAVLFASFSDATGDRNVVVAANATKKIRVLSYTLNAAGGANTVTWETATTALAGAMDIVDNASLHASCVHGLMETVANEALNLSMTAATLVAGHVTYVLI